MFTTAAPITIAPLVSDKVQYDPRKDFVPIALVAVQPVWLTVNADSPLKTLADVVNNAKNQPGKLTYGTSGVGTELHLAAEAIARSAGIQLVHVPFRGGAEVVTALMGHQVDLAALSTASIASPVRQGTLRALAVTSPRRLADFPDVPSIAELGHPAATMLPWWGMMAPAGTPAPIIARLTQELRAATADDGVRERLKATFVQIEFAGPNSRAVSKARPRNMARSSAPPESSRTSLHASTGRRARSARRAPLRCLRTATPAGAQAACRPHSPAAQARP
jgi:tripartite-type tricarboxylate transporter receptor subunit TctC